MKKNAFTISITILFIIIIIMSIYKIVNNIENKKTIITTVTSDNGFKAYALSNIDITNSSANLIFLDDIDGTGQEELIVNSGFTYSFYKYREKYTIEVLKLTDDYITISINGLAPTKETGGFSLIDNYSQVTIKKNTGICLNIQATELSDGSVYFFYVNK